MFMNASMFVYARSIEYSFKMILCFDTMKIERTSTSRFQYLVYIVANACKPARYIYIIQAQLCSIPNSPMVFETSVWTIKFCHGL